MNMLDFSGLQQPPPPIFDRHGTRKPTSPKIIPQKLTRREARKIPKEGADSEGMNDVWVAFFFSLINFHHDVIVVFFF